METLKRFLCDWGSSDSNMLLFFLLTSFLLGLLTGWLIWGRKIQAMLGIVAEKEGIINDLNAKLTSKEEDLKNANAEIVSLKAKIKEHEQEKGQLRSDLIACESNTQNLIAQLDAALAKTNNLSSAVASESAVFAAPNIEAKVAQQIVVEEEEVKAAPIVLMSASDRRDDLKIVEGIGPKIEELCNNIGIYTWEALSETPVERLQAMLDAAGKRYQIHNPSTWAAQAKMAHEEKWDELKTYQDHLKGGKEPV
jgi:predicted flap endonuclease-1-like 5' DNA nuclease